MCLAAPVLPVSRADRKTVNLAKKKIKTETFVSQNVRGLKSTERIEELCSSINQHNVFAACIQETWRTDVEVLQHGNCCILGAGLTKEENSNRGSQGVGIALSSHATHAWRAAGSELHNKFGGRVIAIRLLVRDSEGKDLYLFLVSAYAPVGNADQKEWDEYRRTLDNCIAHKRKEDVLVIGTDTNSSMGCSNENMCTGNFGISHVNESGRRFASYLTINHLIAVTTCFRKRSYGTWIHPRSKNVHQIDHFLSERERLCLISDAGVTGPLIDSDHRAVKCKVRIMRRLKKKTPVRQRLSLLDYTVLSDNDRNKSFCRTVLQNYNTNENTSIYTRLAEAVIQTATKDLPKKQKPQPGWFQQAEDKLMPIIMKRNSATKMFFKRRSRSNAAALKASRKTLKSAILNAKNSWIKTKHNDLNGSSSFRGTKGCWDALSDLRNGLSKTRPSNEKAMKKADGSLCKTPEENAEVFREHFHKLYSLPPRCDLSVAETIPQRPVVQGCDHPPTDEDIHCAIAKLKENAPGESGIPAKIWKILSDEKDTYNILKIIILDFWNTELTPEEWEKGLLTILPKKGDLSLPGNYRGIMLLETAYKIVAIILHERLLPIEEGLEYHEGQCGFRPGRGCTDAIFTVKLAMKKRREHGLESWILFLDLVKAFDRVPREQLWMILGKLGVPTKLIQLLKSLHAHFIIKFSVNNIEHEILNIIGAKQGDVLGPRLFNFFGYAVMLTWHALDNRSLCVFYTKPDFVLTGRSYRARGGQKFDLPDSQYADDTAVLFTSRQSLEESTPLLIAHFAKFGLEIHVGRPGKDSKTEILFVSAPKHTYTEPDTYDNCDLSDVQLGDGTFLPVVDKFCYLGSILSRDCSDEKDIAKRITKASNAFGSVRSQLFSNQNVSFAAKKFIYEGLILPILLYGSEVWCLTEDLYNKLRSFHSRSLRAMCRVNRAHTWKHHISNDDLRKRTGLMTIDQYITKRQLRWAGHLSRMGMERLPRMMLSSWVRNKRPRGCPKFTYGRGLKKALKKAKIDVNNWVEMAKDRTLWRNMLNVI